MLPKFINLTDASIKMVTLDLQQSSAHAIRTDSLADRIITDEIE